jgi:hypothetical protein
MGKPKRRVSPRAANHVNRDLDRLTILCIISAVTTANAHWELNSFGRPCWDPKVAAVCVFMKIFLGRTYDSIEAYLKFNQLVANATAKAKGFPAWQISFNAYTDNPDEWMDEYHIRSIVEAVFSSIKRCLGSDIKSIKGWLKRRELANVDTSHGEGVVPLYFEKVSKATYLADVDMLVMDQERVKYIIEIQDNKTITYLNTQYLK